MGVLRGLARGADVSPAAILLAAFLFTKRSVNGAQTLKEIGISRRMACYWKSHRSFLWAVDVVTRAEKHDAFESYWP